jgi:hypothetical protein
MRPVCSGFLFAPLIREQAPPLSAQAKASHPAPGEKLVPIEFLFTHFVRVRKARIFSGRSLKVAQFLSPDHKRSLHPVSAIALKPTLPGLQSRSKGTHNLGTNERLRTSRAIAVTNNPRNKSFPASNLSRPAGDLRTFSCYL